MVDPVTSDWHSPSQGAWVLEWDVEEGRNENLFIICDQLWKHEL